MNGWEYVVLFLAVMASWAGVPFIGSAAVGACGGHRRHVALAGE
ncbi:MAG TPA: hypothetical protein VGI44_18735 [Acidimicrobiales bacterium]